VTFSTRHEGHYEAAWVMVPDAERVIAVVEETRRRYGR
jgi:hypothetical protein